MRAELRIRYANHARREDRDVVIEEGGYVVIGGAPFHMTGDAAGLELWNRNERLLLGHPGTTIVGSLAGASIRARVLE